MVGHMFCLKHMRDFSLPVQWWVNLHGCEGTCVRAEHGRAARSVQELVAGACEPLPKKEACDRLVHATSFPFP